MDLPLTSMEGYVFSRLDGVLTVDDLCATVGLEHDEVSRIVTKLVELDVVEVLEGDEPESSEPSLGGAPSEAEDAAPLVSSPPDEGGDLAPEVRQLLNALRIRLENSNYYEMLGVPPIADKAAIRRAYFDLSKKLHPDAYFGKNIGKYRALMEEVFGRLTEAYETLSRKDRRAKYDEYVADQIRAWEMERRLRGEDAEPAPPIPDDQPSAHTEQAPARQQPPPRPRPEVKIGAESEFHRKMRQERGRQALMKLIHMSPSGGPPQAQTVMKQMASSIVLEEPKAGGPANTVLAHRYARAGVEALALNDLNTAMNFLQLAAELAPGEQSIKAASEKIRVHAQTTLSHTYEKQGRYEEEAGHYLQAAASFSKALDIRGDDHDLMHRVALNLLRGNGNHDKARDLARQAVKAQPEKAQYRLTLAEIYLKKGWEPEAKQELETACRLDPLNEQAARLLRAMGRQP
jgi:curved DNA-binding protein CbpA